MIAEILIPFIETLAKNTISLNSIIDNASLHDNKCQQLATITLAKKQQLDKITSDLFQIIHDYKDDFIDKEELSSAYTKALNGATLQSILKKEQK